MSSPNNYPFNNEADQAREPQEELGHTALEGDGTQIPVEDQSEPYSVSVGVSSNAPEQSAFPENDALADLGYSEHGTEDFRDQT